MIKKPNIIGIIQARMDSKRLPGKSLKIIRGRPMLQHILDNVNDSKLVDKFVVATSTSSSNKSICDLCDSLNVDYYRGHELDVLSRFIEISDIYDADILIRLTADNPFVEHTFIDCMVLKYLKKYYNYDYMHNCDGCNFPFGLFVEIFSKDALIKAASTKSTEDKEHVTLYFKKNIRDFKVAAVKAENKYKYDRLTVDNQDDFDNAEKIMKELNYPKSKFTYLDLTQ